MMFAEGRGSFMFDASVAQEDRVRVDVELVAVHHVRVEETPRAGCWRPEIACHGRR